MITVRVNNREQLADAIEKIGDENTVIYLHHKHGHTRYSFDVLKGLQYYQNLRPEDISNRAIKRARRFSGVHAYLQHLKNLATKVRRMPKQVFE